MQKFSCLTVALFLVFSSTPSLADVRVRPSAGLGFTNNANFEDTDQDSDFFYSVKSSASYSGDPASFFGSVSYRGYLEETQQNVFNYNLRSYFPVEIASDPDWELNIGIGGQNYLKEAPGTTEESFDNFYFETALSKEMVVEGAKLTVEPRYQLKSYPKFAGRMDHTLAGSALVEWKVARAQILEPWIELGFVGSNQEDYTRTYFELGSDWDYMFKRGLKSEVTFMTRFTTYPNRTVSEPTVVSNRRGKVRSDNADDKETQTFTQLSGGIAKIESRSEYKASLSVGSQDSKSGTADYSELSLMVSALFVF